ncbi:helix-turn-helix protein [Loktanella sp. PT4BL]|jgi:hypothetical protein|uniref:helix-turn-helix domain-containing protein n=1 Tax=Loktanella sp. PT4BL TaxID=2135611 RepID=UPI000D752B5B|nr:helix-turn-helix domain-containing protein [Loktanella sp. PT4BL]PXW65636.1 helix-turn-helix protein [Loktanella sp. PT4BL]
MSHAATNWAIQRRGLKPTTKIVLWHLCDRFNPDYGCFPSQARLAHDCEISRSTLNDHLGQLEAAGLLRRVPRIHPATKRQMPTRYILGFEPGFTPHDPNPCPEIGHGVLPLEGTASRDQNCRAELAHQQDPCPENGKSRVRNPDTNLVREPLREPVKEEEDARDSDFEIFFGKLLGALGFDANAGLPAWWQGWPARQHVRRWIDDLGLSKAGIIEVATETRRDHPNPPDGPKALDRFMERAAQRDAQATAASGSRTRVKGGHRRQKAPPVSPDELAAFYAAKVNSDAYLPPSMISNAICGAMLERGLVTTEQLRARGLL